MASDDYSAYKSLSGDPLSIVVSIDMGKSMNKIIYSVTTEGTKKLLLMEPEVAHLSETQLDKLKKANCHPIDDAWCQFSDESGMAFGLAAQKQSLRLQLQSKKNELKYKIGAKRCFAIICAIIQAEELGRVCSVPDDTHTRYRLNNVYQGVKVALEVLLPLSEYSSHQEVLRKDLESLTRGKFFFRGIKYGIKFDPLNIKPEGAGQLMIRQATQPPFKEQNLLCLIMGHYNVTGILYHRGQFVRSNCPSIGFHQVVELISNATCLDSTNISEARLGEAIYWGQRKPKLIRAFLIKMLSDEASIKRELSRIFSAIEEAKLEYYQTIKRWLIDFVGDDLGILDEVLISGGGSDLFFDDLKDFFESLGEVKIVRNGGQGAEKAIRKAFKLKKGDPLVARLVDCFGVHHALGERVSESIQRAS